VTDAVVLRARDVSLGYGDRTVLAGVDWTVHAGDCWFLIGPNGSGKTTLLRALLGLLAPRRGRLERGPALARPEHLGYVPQRCDLNPSLPTTVREFVSLGFVGTRAAREERAAALAWALAEVGLGELAAAGYWSLSGGQRQRCLVARALVRRPRVLILDEPTEGLDVATQDALLATLESLRREQGMTLLVVTHRLDIAARQASHLAFFHGGGVRAGPREALLADPELRKAFLRVELAS
jgi:ABC-type Mn2+/Zn2+ transport system ATPase subunit